MISRLNDEIDSLQLLRLPDLVKLKFILWSQQHTHNKQGRKGVFTRHLFAKHTVAGFFLD